MPSSWLLNLASFAKGRIKRSSQKQITYTYTVDTSRKPRRVSSRSRLPSSSPGGTSRDSSSGSDSARLPNEIRPGYVVVYVGCERKRFIISTSILSHPLFKLVLEKLDSSDVLDDHLFRDDDETGGILLSCNTDFLHRLLFLIDSGGDQNQEMRWDELKKYLVGESSHCHSAGPSSP
ncbi:unnamed protein product [Calypogeia fissa]